MKDWRPVSDLYVFFGNPLNRLPQACPMPYDVEDSWRNASKNMREPDEKRLEQIVAQEVFSNIGLATLKLCQQFPHAVHGRPFKDKALRDYFYPSSTERTCEDCDETDGCRASQSIFPQGEPDLYGAPARQI